MSSNQAATPSSSSAFPPMSKVAPKSPFTLGAALEDPPLKYFELLNDSNAFQQPNGSHKGDCPICFLPMPIDPRKSTFKSCCSEEACNGCVYVHRIINKQKLCPFCREPTTGDDKECIKRIMKRVGANDPAAIREMGVKRYKEGAYDSAVKYLTKAAELGDVDAHYDLGCIYSRGEGVEKDFKTYFYHTWQAAMRGHPMARHRLGYLEEKYGDTEKAVAHYIIAANLGDEAAMKVLWEQYSLGNITKEDLDATLRTHQAAIDAMKSPQREAAEVIISRNEHIF